MKGPLFVRPNLKWFVFGALLIAVVQQVTISGRSAPPEVPEHIGHSGPGDDHLQQLMAFAANNPSPEAYRRVSLYYERSGRIRKAMLFLREAEKIDDPLD